MNTFLTQNRQRTIQAVMGLIAVALMLFGVERSASAAPTAVLDMVNVGAPAINCIFDSDCTITVYDSTDTIVLPDSSGSGFIQTRTFPVGEADTQADGLYAYLYRIDMRDATAHSATTPCVNWLTLDFGAVEQLNYDGSGGVEDVFVITSGAVGSVSPVEVRQNGDEIQVDFGVGVCAGDSSRFVGLTSKLPAQPIKANVFGWNDGPTLDKDVAVRAPQFVGETVTLYPTIDTWVNTTPGATTPNPQSQLLFVGGDEFTYESYALLQFDMSAIPSGAEVISAELDLWHEYSASTTWLAHDICAHQVTSAWNASVTAATAPSINKACLASTTVEDDWGSHIWSDVGSLVQSWVDGSSSNHGVALQQDQYSYGFKAFQSSEGNVSPALRVTYHAPTALDDSVQQLRDDATGLTEVSFDGTLPYHVATAVDVASLDENPVAQAQLFLNEYNTLYDLPDPISGLYLDRITQSEGAGRAAGGSHVFFKQRINDVPVFGAALAVHIEDGVVTSTNGRYLQDAPQFPAPAMSAWEAEQLYIQQYTQGSAEIIGETRLVLFNWSLLGGDNDTTYQTWEMRVAGPMFSGSVFFSTDTGELIAQISDVHEGRPGEDFAISDHTGRSRRDCGTGTVWFDENGAVSYPGAGGDSNADGSTANSALHESYHFFYDNFGRRSWNNRGELIPVQARCV